MAEPSTQYTKLPPGWDCKFDQTTGNCYYINYLTKAMQLEDPRIRYKQLQNEKCSTESIPMQPMHGSPYHVYPTNNFPAIRAFQGPNPSLHNISASPLLSTKSQLQMEMSPVSLLKSSAPQTPRTGNMSRRSTIQETSFSSQIDTDAVVAKIQNMFPTAGENHIRLLLKKYMKNIFPKADETLLLDILANSDNNVQKASETLIAMGYTKRDVAPPPKLTNRGDGKPTNMDGEECNKIIPLRPKVYTQEEKDQMKTRLQEKFNQIAERIILMALESVNYSEDRATQILQIVHDEDESRARKDADTLQCVLAEDSCVDGVEDASNNLPTAISTSISTKSTSIETRKLGSEQLMSVPIITYSPTTTNDVKSVATKDQRKNSKVHTKKYNENISEKYSSSTLYHISSSLSPLFPKYTSSKPSSLFKKLSSKSSSEDGTALKWQTQSDKLSRCREKFESLKSLPKESSEDGQDILQKQEFQSILGRIASMGHNTDYAKGPDDNLLLADYVTWNGANPDITLGRKNIAMGPDPSIVPERSYTANGRNPELCKGPKAGLAKGSIYSQLKSSTNTNIKCN